jgi:hypothetical protein
MTAASLIEKLTRLIEIKQESWELHYSAKEIAAACIEMCHQHQPEPALADEVELAAYLRSRRLAWEAQGLGRLYDQDREVIEIVMERFRPYLRTSAPELTEEEKREAVEVMAKAQMQDGVMLSSDPTAMWNAALSALLERFEIRRRG